MHYMCGREGFKHNMKTIGLVRGWAKDHPCTNSDLTHGPSPRRENVKIILKQTTIVNEGSEEKMQIDPLTEDPKEQRHLRNTLSNYLHRKVKVQGRQQSCASNGMGKYLGS